MPGVQAAQERQVQAEAEWDCLWRREGLSERALHLSLKSSGLQRRMRRHAERPA